MHDAKPLVTAGSPLQEPRHKRPDWPSETPPRAEARTPCRTPKMDNLDPREDHLDGEIKNGTSIH